METVTDFIFLGFKITADSDCSHEIKTLVPWKKNYDVGIQSHHFMSIDGGKNGNSDRLYFIGLQNHWEW